MGRLQRKLGVLEEEEIGVFLKLHPESPYCYDIKTSSSSNFFKCEKSAYLKKEKKGVFTEFLPIGHFRVPKNLTFKARLSAKPLI